MTGTDRDLFTHKSSGSYLNHLVATSFSFFCKPSSGLSGIRTMNKNFTGKKEMRYYSIYKNCHNIYHQVQEQVKYVQYV